jgi:hypothetical protein
MSGTAKTKATPKRKTRQMTAFKAAKKNRPPIHLKVQWKLWLLAAGRCEFYGCNEPLWIDTLTLHETNYSNIAHIVSWTKDGPRGDDPMPLDERNDIENLMLACTKHHKLIDSKEHEAKYPKELLLRYKRMHEECISIVTDYKPEAKTTVVRLKANIGTEAVEASNSRMRKAIAPRYPADLRGIEIDLTQWPELDSDAYWQMMCDLVTQKIAQAYTPGIEADPAEHLSVFAIGPMPILVHLGSCLSNKIPVDLYQRHRDNQDWTWKEDGEPVKYKVSQLREGNNLQKVALLLSLSGRIREDELPDEIGKEFSIYQITLDGIKPDTSFLRRPQDLDEFRNVYRQFWRDLWSSHGPLKEVYLFPAVPAPIAVACGMERLQKIDPALVIYDRNKNKGGFKRTLKVK